MKNLTIAWTLIAAGCVLGALAGYRLGMNSVPDGAEGTSGEHQAADASSAGLRRGSSKAGRPSVQARELGRQMAAEMRSGDRTSWGAVEERIRDLAKGELLIVLEELDGLATGRQRAEAMLPVLHRLARIDPPLALEEAGKYLGGMELPRARGLVLREWALSNPATALEQARALENEFAEGIDYVSSVFQAWGGEDFDRALSFVGTLQDPREMQLAVRALGSAAGSSEERQARLLDIAQRFDDPSLRREFVQRGVRTWAQNGNREELAAWIEAAKVDVSERRELLRAVAEGSAYRDPQRTAVWLMEQATPESWAGDLETAVSAWADSQPEACGQWLAGHMQGSEADPAVAQYSSILARRNPVQALTWAMRIHGEDLRGKALNSIVRSMGPVPVETVRDNLEEAGLAEEQVGRLLEKREEEGW